MIAPIENVANWRLIYRRKKTLIDRNTDQENRTRSNNHFRVGDQVLIRNNQGNKYDNSYKGPYTSIHMWTNEMISLRMGVKSTEQISAALNRTIPNSFCDAESFI